MNRRPWMMAVLLAAAVAATGCGANPGPDSDRLAGELAEVKADRDRLAVLVRQLSTTSATLEAYAVNNRQGCLDRLRTVRKRIVAARADLGAGRAAKLHLDSAGKGLDEALGGDCAPAAP